MDFGTLSGRAVVVRVRDGAELGSAVCEYAHGVLSDTLPGGGPRLPPEWALQVPDDYREVLRTAVPEAVAASGVDPSTVVGLGLDATSCTMVPTTRDGTPLCELPGLRDRPHAYVKLWRHHAAQPQADRVTELATARGEPWLARYGGIVSSEWQLPKALQVLEEDPEVYARTERWVEAADWIVWQLCDELVVSAGAAGYKGLRQDGAYPSRDFLGALDPGLAGLVEEKHGHVVGALGAPAGRLTARAAAWTGLPAGIPVAVGNVDAHVTAPAAGATEPGQLVLIMGTSTCHILSSDVLREVPGLAGVVDGGVIDGLWGYEAGQSGVGDIFGWFTRTGVPADYAEEARRQGVSLHDHLTRLAAAQAVGEHGLLALDWHSGNRSVLVDHDLSGLVLGQTLATRPEDTYRALLEATAYGTRLIVETIREGGVPVEDVVVAGGLARNSLLLQIYADVLRLPLSVIDSEQGAALGSAIHAAVAAGAHPDVRSAARAMGRVRRAAYRPEEERSAAYDVLYGEYRRLHDYFGRGGNEVMHRLRSVRRTALAERARARPSMSAAPEDSGRT